jgi:hypothetical protein
VRPRAIAANGIRLVLDEHRATTTPTLKSGQPGKTKVAYGDVDDAAAWLWKFVVCRAGGYAESVPDARLRAEMAVRCSA